MHCGLSFIAPFCQYANYCKVKWLTDLEGSVRLNHKTTYFPHLHLLQWCADCFARFLAPSFHLMCVNGILFVFSQIFWKVGKNFPEKMLRTIHRPHSQSVSLYSAVKRKLQVHFIYTGHRHKFAFKGFTICKKYDILYPLPIFQLFQHHKPNSISLQCCHTDHFFYLLTTERFHNRKKRTRCFFSCNLCELNFRHSSSIVIVMWAAFIDTTVHSWHAVVALLQN